MDHRVWRKWLAEIIWGGQPPKTRLHTETDRSLTTAGRPDLYLAPFSHSPRHWDAGSGEGPRGGTRPQELSTATVISHKQPPRLQRPVSNNHRAQSYQHLIHPYHLKHIYRHVHEDSGASPLSPKDQAWLQRPPRRPAPLLPGCDPSTRAARSYILVSLFPRSFGN